MARMYSNNFDINCSPFHNVVGDIIKKGQPHQPRTLLIFKFTKFSKIPTLWSRVSFPQNRRNSRDLLQRILVAHTLYILSSPRAKRAGPKGLRAESAMAFTGRRNSYSGRGEDFLSRQPNFFTETAVTPERKVEKSFPRWEINRHVEG